MNYRGTILILSLVFGSIFALTFGALTTSVLIGHRSLEHRLARAKALEIAEAGLNYYRWHLAHAPDDFTSDLGEHAYRDPYGGIIGYFSLSIEEPASGSTVVTITSTGWTVNYPNVQRTLQAKYGKPSLAKYAFITNANVWFGEDEEVKGELHSNGGIRMDGQGNSAVTSALETYICGPEHGCDYEEKPGVWGEGEIQALWEYPVSNIDFNELTVDLSDMQTEADLTLPDSGYYGYQIVFQADGTFDVNYVTAVLSGVRAYNGTSWVWEYDSVRTTSPVTGYQDVSLSNIDLIFVEDKLWVQGTVNGRVTIAAAKLPEGIEESPSIIIQNDLTYTAHDGSSALGLIAQQDVRVPLDSEDNLEIDGALIAKNGHVFRNYYVNRYIPSSRRSYNLRTKIETYGIIMTNTIWTWSWVNSSGTVISGYQTTETSYDPYFYYAPPPYFPTTDEYEFISWEETPNP